ncbi:MAG TPA: hypothetical protein VJM46_00870 [Candidatus Saccharimonadales bacterium]|nr:hypothetical protein [Candidatus Saccharimonadales bacterium]
MPSAGQQRHERIVRLFRGDFGDDIYESFVLSGRRQRETTSLRAYVSIYADRTLRFTRVTETRLTEQSAHARIKRLTIAPEDVAKQYTQIQVLRPGGAPDALDETLWQLAGARTTPLQLPLALVTFLSTIDGAQKIVFWSSRMAPGDWMFRQIQNRIR